MSNLVNERIKDTPILELKNISKSFGPVRALNEVNLRLFPGKVTAVIGENGAGKSTLMNIISGVHKKTNGQMFLNNYIYEPKSIKHAEKMGISIIHQELLTIPYMTVMDNIFLGSEIYTIFGSINYSKQASVIRDTFNRLGVGIEPHKLIGELTVAEQQMVEIAKAIIKKSNVILMDEPTSSLSEKETASLFKTIHRLKNENIAIAYISHRLQELPEISDYLTIIRDGQYMGEYILGDIDEEEMINKMVGREIKERYPAKFESENKVEILKIKNWGNDYSKNINFSINSGEILGFSGLIGAGRSELFKSIVGEIKKNSGNIFMNDKVKKIRNTNSAIKNGIYYVTEDRKVEGLIIEQTIKFNISLSSLSGIQNKLTRSISTLKENRKVYELFKETTIKAPNFNYRINQLSGGNQQKVLIAKSLMSNPSILILDEPTRGVDVGARREIYDLISKMKKEHNTAIVIISSDLPEIIGLCDRVLVMKDGQITKEIIDKKDFTQDEIIKYAI
ncbi:ribose transport system ATP-binding protein [Spiroplasma chinense]|uniref:Ribose transport system ATP-binding protein n=1 Tax=Spiroplasma chinense TaxID=216932 RepID=A0A5B9Y578_9MOLU|nr:sugar ABC transporter ATP-binding protein [Spiroplasma chinense]QEH61849.1 ribose transport system ATP-binding protein [Spiroplasma chinense]